MVKIIGVRFRNVGKIYYFNPKSFQMKPGDHVIVETARGVEYGTVVLGPKEVDDRQVVQPLKDVIRMATQKDDAKEESNRKNSINTANNIKNIVLGAPITLDDFIAVARYGAAVEFSDEYCRRVEKSRELVEQWVSEEKVMYGVTTGFGALCTKAIGKDETAKLQENIILSHSVSVGEPLSIERVRGIMLMVLQNLGQGYSGSGKTSA